MGKAKNTKKDSKVLSIQDELQILVDKYNAELAGEKNSEVLEELDDKISIRVMEFNKQSKKECYDALATFDNKMYAAIEKFSYPSCRISDKMEDKQLVRNINYGMKEISLPDVNKFFGGIGANKKWEEFVEKFNYLMTKRACTKLGAKSNLTEYAFKKASETFDISVEDLEEEENVKVALQAVITAMLGDGKTVSDEDVYYVKSVHLKKGRAACSVTATQLKAMHSLIFNICHHIISERDYSVSFKTKNKK